MLAWFLKQNFLALSAGFAILIFSFLFYILFARLLTKEEFGLLVTFISLVMLFSSFSDLGTSNAIMRFVGRSIFSKDKVTGSYLFHLLKIRLAAALLVSIIVFIFSDQLSQIILHTAAYSFIFKYAAGISFFFVLVQFLSSLFSSLNNYAYVSFCSFTVNILRFAVPILFIVIFNSIDLNLIILGVSISFLLSAAIHVYLFARLRLDVTQRKANFLEINNFILFAAVVSIITPFASNFDAIILNFFRNASEVALYKAAQAVTIALYHLIPFSSAFLFSFFVETEAKKIERIHQKVFERVIKYGALVLIPVSFLVFFLSKKIILALYPSNYLDASLALQILSVTPILSFLSGMGNSLLASKGMMDKIAKITTLSTILMLIASISLVPIFGFIGSTLAVLIYFCISSVATIALSLRTLRAKLHPMIFIKPTIVSLVLTFIILNLRELAPFYILLPLGLIAFAILYLPFLDGDDRALIKRIARSIRGWLR